jgi:hypothetical protein
MGYMILVGKTNIRIKNENKQAALRAAHALQGQETCKTTPEQDKLFEEIYGQPGGDHFMWVDPHVFRNATTLEEVLTEWRWTPVVDPDTGDITFLEFTGQKRGDDELLFRALAPYIEAGSYIHFTGEYTRENWQFVFDGKEMKVLPLTDEEYFA